MSKYTGNVSERVMCKCSFDYTPALWGYASSGAIRIFLGSINSRISQHVLYSQGDENSRYLHLSPSVYISIEACRHAVTRFYCISLCGLYKILWQRTFSYPINFFLCVWDLTVVLASIHRRVGRRLLYVAWRPHNYGYSIANLCSSVPLCSKEHHWPFIALTAADIAPFVSYIS